MCLIARLVVSDGAHNLSRYYEDGWRRDSSAICKIAMDRKQSQVGKLRIRRGNARRGSEASDCSFSNYLLDLYSTLVPISRCWGWASAMVSLTVQRRLALFGCLRSEISQHEWPKDDYGRTSVHPTRPVGHGAGARHASPRYILLLCFLVILI